MLNFGDENVTGKAKVFSENMPGGIHCCKCDPELTLLDMSHGFFSLTGYSQEEIETRFHNHYIEMIDPKDVEAVRAQIDAQLLKGDTLELEYRMLRGDGSLIWILDHSKRVVSDDGQVCFYCMLMDITKKMEEREQLRLSLERHRIIMDQTTDIIFEWDIQKDTLIVSGNWYKKFGYAPIQEGISQKLLVSKNVYEHDVPVFVQLIEALKGGKPYTEAELRIRNADGSFIWNRIRATAQYDRNGHPIKTIGVILDIDADKKQRQNLLERAQRDALTGLYNKEAIQELIVQKMQESEGGQYQALLIIDLDNFKQVNDTYGHLYGDTLLSDVAGILKSCFEPDALVGRIGGDEFVAYLPETAGESETAARVEQVQDAFHRYRPLNDMLSVSCSIGVALFPQKGIDYYGLYKCADMALYHIKANGKNDFAFYNPSDCDGRIPCGLTESAVGMIDSEMQESGDEVGRLLIQYVFRMLYKSIDVKTAVGQILEIVGRAYDVSRVYIFENAEDGQSCSNTFEWCAPGVTPQIQNLKNLSYQRDLVDYIDNFDSDHIFYCQDIRQLRANLYNVMAPQGICSLLQCAIMDDGIFKGYVGFDECRENRRWTTCQINSLAMIASVLSTFLMKLRLKEALAKLKGDETALKTGQ